VDNYGGVANPDGVNTTFSGNTAADGGDIYMGTGTTLALTSYDDKSITFASGISGDAGGYTIDAGAMPGDTGSVVINSYINNANIQIADVMFHLAQGSSLNNSTLTMNSNSTLNTISGSPTSFAPGVLTFNGNVNLMADVNIGKGLSDDFSNATQSTGTITLTGVNQIGNLPKTTNYLSINLTDALGLQGKNVAFNNLKLPTVLTPIRYLQASVNNSGFLNYSPQGNSFKDFNPAIMAAPVGAQVGGFFTQINSYNQAFMNIDMKMLMTQEERKALRMRNSYASADETNPMVFSPTFLAEQQKGVWVRPYSTFENVGLRGGAQVSNVMYGSFFGGDSDMYDLGNGFEGQFSLYAGYNGSRQVYNGISIDQNGGTLGVTGAVYKGNFFSALTANASASGADAYTMYGFENFNMLMAGVASKTGYNWELAHGKFIIQPSFLASYTFVDTFNYNNAAGINVSSSPLNAIQIVPGIKLIGNLKNGWQPYVGLNLVYNIMDSTHFKAAEISLPQLSVRPYFEYGLGVQKHWGDRFTGFVQSMFRSGGRNGVALTLGFRIAIGPEPYKKSMDTTKKVIK